MSDSEPDDVTPSGSVDIPVIWVGSEELPTIKVNQFIVQVDAFADVFLTLGTLTPPILTGETDVERVRQAEAIGYVPVRGVAKLSLSEQNLRELLEVLTNGLKMVEQRKEAAK